MCESVLCRLHLPLHKDVFASLQGAYCRPANVALESVLAICFPLSILADLCYSQKDFSQNVSLPKNKIHYCHLQRVKNNRFGRSFSPGVSTLQLVRQILLRAFLCVCSYELRMFFTFFKSCKKKKKERKYDRNCFGLQCLKYLLSGPFQKKPANPWPLAWLPDTVILCALLLGK